MRRALQGNLNDHPLARIAAKLHTAELDGGPAERQAGPATAFAWAGVARGIPQALVEFQALYPYISITVSESPLTQLLEAYVSTKATPMKMTIGRYELMSALMLRFPDVAATARFIAHGFGTEAS